MARFLIDRKEKVMAISEEDRLKFEKDFKYLVEKYVEFLSYYNRMVIKETRTIEEEKEFQTIQQLLLNIGEVLSIALKSIGDDLFGKALDLYYHYKNMAADGDKDAMELLEDLKPMLAASLNSRINKN